MGDKGVGKTSLLQAVCDSGKDNSGHNYKKTIIIDGKSVVIEVSENNMAENITFADGVIIMYDVTNKSSFDNAKYWIQKIEIVAENNVAIVIVGNKCDLLEKVVEYATAKKYFDEKGLTFIETSVKDSIHVEEPFRILATQIDKSRHIVNEPKKSTICDIL